MLLNHERSGLPPLSEPVVSGLVDERLRVAVIELAAAHKKSWGDELHPTEQGFRAVADRFDRVLRTL